MMPALREQLQEQVVHVGSVNARIPQQIPRIVGAWPDTDQRMLCDAVKAHFPDAQALRDGIVDGADG